MGIQLSSLEQMPQALNYLINKIEGLELSISRLTNVQPISTHKEWMNITELCDYLPTHPARQTVYEWVKSRTIPFHKTSKMLTFNKNEIDSWLHGGYRKTIDEIERESEEYMNSRSYER